jgi:hypothetical protein
MPGFLNAIAVSAPIICCGSIVACAINTPPCDAGLLLEAYVFFPCSSPTEDGSPPVRVRPPVPPATTTAPPSSPKSDDVGGKSFVVDEACLKRAIDTVKAKYAFDAKAFTDANRAKAKAAYDVAKARYDAARKERNSPINDDKHGYEDNGVHNRGDNFGDRSRGIKPPPPPKMADFETWPERMKAEVKAEGTLSYADSVKRGKPIPPADYPLNGPKLKAFVKDNRGQITDTRLMGLIEQIAKEYQGEVSKISLEPAKSETAKPTTNSQPASTPTPTLNSEPKPQEVSFTAGGLRIGDPLTVEWSNSHCPIQDKGKSDVFCTESIKSAEGLICMGFQFEESKLIGVVLVFDSVCFDTLVRSYAEKFGTPPHQKMLESVTNPIGEKYENQIVTWKTTDGDFTLKKYGSNVKDGFGMLETPQLVKYNQKQQDANQKDLKGKL